MYGVLYNWQFATENVLIYLNVFHNQTAAPLACLQIWVQGIPLMVVNTASKIKKVMSLLLFSAATK